MFSSIKAPTPKFYKINKFEFECCDEIGEVYQLVETLPHKYLTEQQALKKVELLEKLDNSKVKSQNIYGDEQEYQTYRYSIESIY